MSEINKKAQFARGAIQRRIIVLACSALFVALSIICGKYLAIPFGNILRFSFENLPIILSGVLFGPLMGALVGALADLLGCILVGYAINPLVTAGAVAVGLLSGIIFRVTKKLPVGINLCLTVAVAHIVGSVVIKTFGLSVWYDIPLYELMLWRFFNYLIVGILEFLLLYAILRVKTISDLKKN